MWKKTREDTQQKYEEEKEDFFNLGGDY